MSCTCTCNKGCHVHVIKVCHVHVIKVCHVHVHVIKIYHVHVHVYYRFQNVSSLYHIVHGIHQLQIEDSKVLYLILNYISLFTNAIFLSGDILYIDVIIMEGDEYCITATPSGFFLNRSIPGSKFDPHPRKIAHHSQHLVTLLQQVNHLLILLLS